LLFVDSCVEEEVHEAMAEVVMVVNWEVLGALMKLHHDGPVEELSGANPIRPTFLRVVTFGIFYGRAVPRTTRPQF
jgi:hypothetical protein